MPSITVKKANDWVTLMAMLVVVLLFIAQQVWDIATDLPVQILANSSFLVLSLLSWGGVHYLLSERDVELHTSRILMTELLPAATFSFAMVYYTYPAIIEFIYGAPPSYVVKGTFWNVMQVIGAIMITASTISWISLVSGEPKKEQ